MTETEMTGGERAISHIVQSTSLHANLLHDSEALRSSVPGLERFKLAARLNVGEFYAASVTLRGPVKQWDPKAQAWAAPFTVKSQHEGEGEEAGLAFGEEEFAYFLASSTTPRLEPTFEILPTLSEPGEGTMDLLIMRPRRDPRVQSVLSASASEPPSAPKPADTEDTEDKATEEDPLARFSPAGRTWAVRAQEVLTAAYHAGAHINLCYPTAPASPSKEEGEDMLHLHPHSDGLEAVPATSGRAGEPVAELFRCAGFTWAPADSASKAGLVCADGAISRVPSGGAWSVRVLETGDEGFWAYGP